MREKDLNKSGLALKLGVSDVAIGRWLRREREPNDESISRLADYFNVSPIEIYQMLGRLEEIDLDAPLSRLVEVARKLTPEGRADLLAYAVWRREQERDGSATAASGDSA
jgi:transcriptional regulator with XRE-family HTH domain